jgi:Mycothiol-dependent nitroreductase Rv2466c
LRFDDGDAFFGPVLVDPPRGPAAVRLWDHLIGWREFPHVYEVQRPKRPEDQRLIAETFRPYLEARDWNTIQNPSP